jgi:ATP-dependent RNA helicase DDX21
LIATNVAARGLDFPEIDLIIQMQPPNTTDAYIHRSGRTGRAGKSGVCLTFYSFKEEHLMKRI